mmetsp:Transcript_100692/g.285346  ORF Transcript_100692/g.285346 Transcript_100692/m.285346 type:complete len:207 (-) Transcript_100692:285-905(-)
MGQDVGRSDEWQPECCKQALPPLAARVDALAVLADERCRIVQVHDEGRLVLEGHDPGVQLQWGHWHPERRIEESYHVGLAHKGGRHKVYGHQRAPGAGAAAAVHHPVARVLAEAREPAQIHEHGLDDAPAPEMPAQLPVHGRDRPVGRGITHEGVVAAGPDVGNVRLGQRTAHRVKDALLVRCPKRNRFVGAGEVPRREYAAVPLA